VETTKGGSGSEMWDKFAGIFAMLATGTRPIVDGEVSLSLDPSDISAVDVRRWTGVTGQDYAAMRVICGKSRRWPAREIVLNSDAVQNGHSVQ